MIIIYIVKLPYSLYFSNFELPNIKQKKFHIFLKFIYISVFRIRRIEINYNFSTFKKNVVSIFRSYVKIYVLSNYL